MKVKVAKWGNSLAVRLPKHYADELGLKAGAEVELEREGSRLSIAPSTRQEMLRYRLEDLLAQIKPGGEPPPFEDWGILPSEWPAEDWSDVAPPDEEWEVAKKEWEEGRAARRRS